MSKDNRHNTGLPYDPTVNQYDEVSSLTGGKLNANHAAMAASMIGGVTPGFVPIVGDAAAAGLQTYAQSAETQNDLVQIAWSLGMVDGNGRPDADMLMRASNIFKHEHVYVSGGSLLGDNMRRAGMSAAGAIPGAMAGAAIGSAILPFGGTLIGGAIGGISGNFAGGKADDALFANKSVTTADGNTLDTKVNVSEFARDKMYAQAQGQIKAADVEDAITILASQHGGISKQMMADITLSRLMGADYIPGDPSNTQRAAMLFNSQGGPNFLELFLKPEYMEARPPTPLVGMQAQQPQQAYAMQYDPSFNGAMPGGPSMIPSGVGPGMGGPGNGPYYGSKT